MNTKTTTVWIEGNDENVVTVDYSVTDLDEAARLLGYPDYDELVVRHEVNNGPVDPEDSPLCFRYEYDAELYDDEEEDEIRAAWGLN